MEVLKWIEECLCAYWFVVIFEKNRENNYQILKLVTLSFFVQLRKVYSETFTLHSFSLYYYIHFQYAFE